MPDKAHRLERALRCQKRVRVVGFDDAPFQRTTAIPVNIAGVVCANTRFEGLLWGEVTFDGTDATERMIALLVASKFYRQVHLVLIDGLAVGGFNIIDLPRLATALALPCVAVMRRPPDFAAIDTALRRFDDAACRRALIRAAGPVYQRQGFVFQAAGCTPVMAAAALCQVTDTGKVPEALRLAHLIGAAVKTGESSRRA